MAGSAASGVLYGEVSAGWTPDAPVRWSCFTATARTSRISPRSGRCSYRPCPGQRCVPRSGWLPAAMRGSCPSRLATGIRPRHRRRLAVDRRSHGPGRDGGSRRILPGRPHGDPAAADPARAGRGHGRALRLRPGCAAAGRRAAGRAAPGRVLGTGSQGLYDPRRCDRGDTSVADRPLHPHRARLPRSRAWCAWPTVPDGLAKITVMRPR